MSKLKIMENKEIREDELKPVVNIFTLFIVPVLMLFLFEFAASINIAGFLAFVIFLGLGYYDYRTQNEK